MIVQSIRVRCFRSIYDETLHCGDLTAIIGPNGCGKSSFLRALELFYAKSPKLTIDDFYGKDTSQDIEITVSFKDLNDREGVEFRDYLDGDGLSVSRVLTAAGGRDGAKYHGTKMLFPGFAVVRGTSGAREKMQVFNALADQFGFQRVRAAGDIEAQLSAWEAENPGRLERMLDDGQFFGWNNVGRGRLLASSSFILIPAVRDAAQDLEEGRSSALNEIMARLVRSAFEQRKEVAEFRLRTQTAYRDLVNPERVPELRDLSENLSRTLQEMYPDLALSVTWQANDLELGLPAALARLVEDGFQFPAANAGHGQQRAVVMTMLQHLAAAVRSTAPQENEASPDQDEEREQDRKDGEEIEASDLIIGIEEPELYQHPAQSRHLAELLRRMAATRNTPFARRTQIIFGTHSPAFVSLDRFTDVRRARKVLREEGRPKETKLRSSDFTAVASLVHRAKGEHGYPETEAELANKLGNVVTPNVSEAFFADLVVLAEGEGDVAAIRTVAEHLRATTPPERQRLYSLEARNVAVLCLDGKGNILRVGCLLQSLGIPVYPVFDNDRSNPNAVRENPHLLRMVGVLPEEYPVGAHLTHAAFDEDREAVMRAEVGKVEYERILSEVLDRHDLDAKAKNEKRSVVVRDVIRQIFQEGRAAPTLVAIVERIVELRNALETFATVAAEAQAEAKQEAETAE